MPNMLGQLVLASWLEHFTEFRLLNNELWRWVALFGVLLGSLIVGKIISFALQHQARRMKDAERTPLLATLLTSVAGPITLLILAGGLYAASTLMNLTYVTVVEKGDMKVPETTDLADFWIKICSTLTVLAAGWFIYRLVDIIEYFLQRWTSRTETSLDDQLVPLIRKTLRVFVIIVLLLFIAQNIFKWNIGSLIAG